MDVPNGPSTQEEGAVTRRPLPIVFAGALNRSHGYANAYENLLHIANADGRFDVHAQNVWMRQDNVLLPNTLDLLSNDSDQQVDVGVILAAPQYFDQINSRYRIGWSMYETDDILYWHNDWPELFSTLTALIVPTAWQLGVFRAQVYKGPTHVIPLPISPNIKYKTRSVKYTGFTVGTWGTLTARKGIQETVDAFMLAFPEEQYPDCRLILKTQRGILNDPERQDYRYNKRVHVRDAIWSEQQMIQFIDSLDAAIFLSRAEGYGMPAREAIVRGIPTVVHTVTGHAPLRDVAWPVPSERTERAHMGGTWYIASVDHAATQLRNIYNDRVSAIKRAKVDSDILSKRISPSYILDCLERIYHIVVGD